VANLLQASERASRLADTLLRTTGGRCVLLRLAAPAAANDDSEQLGFATPQFQDIPLEPVSFRKADSATAVLLASAVAVKSIAGTLALDSVNVLFTNAVGVVIDDVLYEIESTRTSQAVGEPYCYCLTLRSPAQ
jgi:hypothetical protein